MKPVEPMTQDPKGPGSSRQKPAQREISQSQLAPTTPTPSPPETMTKRRMREDWSQATK